MIVLLVGINILVFSSSIYGDKSAAILHAVLGMGCTAVLLLGIHQLRKTQQRKKSMHNILDSRENS